MRQKMFGDVRVTEIGSGRTISGTGVAGLLCNNALLLSLHDRFRFARLSGCGAYVSRADLNILLPVVSSALAAVGCDLMALDLSDAIEVPSQGEEPSTGDRADA